MDREFDIDRHVLSVAIFSTSGRVPDVRAYLSKAAENHDALTEVWERVWEAWRCERLLPYRRRHRYAIRWNGRIY